MVQNDGIRLLNGTINWHMMRYACIDPWHNFKIGVARSLWLKLALKWPQNGPKPRNWPFPFWEDPKSQKGSPVMRALARCGSRGEGTMGFTLDGCDHVFTHPFQAMHADNTPTILGCEFWHAYKAKFDFETMKISLKIGKQRR